MVEYKIDEAGLQKHREQTVEEILELLKEHDRVACVRFTGYGKSYYVVPELIRKLNAKCLIVVPSTPLVQQYKDNFKNTDSVKVVTYQSIKNILVAEKIEKYQGFEYVICDECHHLGNNKWRKNFEEFIKTLDVKVLGLTATPVRGDSVDVITTFFDNVQTESLDLLDGINLCYLPKVKYVVAYAKVEDLDDFKLTQVDRYKIENLQKVENIIKKYIDEQLLQQNLKVLLYVSQVKYIEDAKQQVKLWFDKIYPNKKILVYDVNSKASRNYNRQQLNDFKVIHSVETIDVMVSVDMLMEGLHLPTINVEIMLRKTQSNVVYTQQMGRVINSSKPVIFDLINNSAHLYQIKQEYAQGIGGFLVNENNKVMFDNCVELYDETKEIEEILLKYRDKSNSMHTMTQFETQVLAKKSEIESYSGKVSYRELERIVLVPREILVKLIKKYDIKFVSSYKKPKTQSEVDEIIISNKDDIQDMMQKGIPLEKQAQKFELSFTTYKGGLERNQVEITYLWQKFEAKYDMNKYNQFIDLYVNQNLPKRTIKLKLDLNDSEYLSFQSRAVYDGFKRRTSEDKSLRLTDVDKTYIRNNCSILSDDELQNELNKPMQKIKDYIRYNNLRPYDDKKIKYLTDIQKKNIKHLYLTTDLSCIAISKIVGCGDHAVRGYLERESLRTPKSKVKRTPEIENQIREDYLNGATQMILEQNYHISHKALREILGDILITKEEKRKQNKQIELLKIKDSVKKDFKQGMSKTGLQKKYHIGIRTLNKVLFEM